MNAQDTLIQAVWDAIYAELDPDEIRNIVEMVLREAQLGSEDES